MLQVSTGRFFSTTKINEEEFSSILYSNLSCFEPISTVVGDFIPADIGGTGISSYIFRYTMRYEPCQGDILIMPGHQEAAWQFQTLVSMWFDSFFHPDRHHVEMLCRRATRHGSDGGVPSRFVDRFFDPRTATTTQDIERFAKFVKKVTHLPRAIYRHVIRCSRAFIDALEAIDTNRDLAYSMFVYSLEALSQVSDDFVPEWSDFPQNIRKELDKLFAEMQAAHVEKAKAILLDNPHLRLKKRFVGFVESHLSNAFFTYEAKGRLALPKSDLMRALSNLYDTRSGFVHSLKPIQDQLRQPNWAANSDFFSWDNQPFLTFSGLARLVRHALLQFIERQPSLENEVYPNWRNEIPGIIEARLAPKYWVARIDNLHREQAVSRFNGFLDHISGNLQNERLVLPDMRALMGHIESLAPQCKVSDRRAWLCLYYLFHCFIPSADRRPNWEKFLGKYASETDPCAIELMACEAVLLKRFDWPVTDCEQQFENYLQGRYGVRAINLPRRVELAIMSGIANLHAERKDVEGFRRWIDKAILDAAGDGGIQLYFHECRESFTTVDTFRIFGIPPSSPLLGCKVTESKVSDAEHCWISDNAYFRWLRDGQRGGNALTHWLDAESEYRRRMNDL